MHPPNQTPELHVLLLGNYRPDGQRSMRRFAELLSAGLTQRNITVETYQPPVVIGKLGAKGYGFGKWLGYIDKYLLFPFFLKHKLRQLKVPHIVHICDHSNAPYTRWLQHTPHLVTCHDLLAVRAALDEIPQHKLKWTGKQQQAMILRGLKRSACIASVSDATRDDVARLVGNEPSRLHVITNALDDSFIQMANSPTNTSTRPNNPLRLPSNAPYVMHIGGEKWYKNRAAVLRFFAKLSQQDDALQLAIVGPCFSKDQLKANQCDTLAERIHYLEGIDDAELQTLYSGAELLLFPSSLEGFGWPILEAQACGCAVATLNIAPMNELNATTALILDANATKPQWHEHASDQCLKYIQLNASEKAAAQIKMKQFAATFTNNAAISAYCALYQERLTSTATV
ncbi:MAG TPA: glycosyltransferase family 1 protein [Opitutae bacterium]|nr:glycosyltransferase family 1 protein [Opitutae bacterium]